MGEFRVETSELAAVGGRYDAIGQRLEENLTRLHKTLAMLKGQTVDLDVLGSLIAAISELEAAARELKNLGADCRKIAGVYERVERQVASLVAALPSVSPFSSSSPPGQPAAAPTTAAEHTVFVRVESRYRPAPPVFISGNRLPCESWLLARAAKATMEGDTSWK